MALLRLYDYAPSGNCLKVRILLAHLGVSYERIGVDIFAGDTLTDDYARKNPARRTPVLEVDGQYLPESSAILWYLGHGTAYLASSPLTQASILRWLLFERENVEQIAALRFRLLAGLLDADDETVPARRTACRYALEQLESHVSEHSFLADGAYTIADIANYAYVHLVPDVDIDLGEYPAVRSWLARIEEQPGFVNDLAPMPANARVGRGLSIYG
jgi:glutathione S-transferase